MSEKDERRIEQLQKQIEDMKQQLNNKMVEMRFEADKTMEKGREVVRDRPLTAVGIAFGVGLIVGAILLKAFKD